jgi:hypothetical protein
MGNDSEHAENTYCYQCNELLIFRQGFTIVENYYESPAAQMWRNRRIEWEEKDRAVFIVFLF